MKNPKAIYLLILIAAIFIRFIFIGLIPPLGTTNVIIRILTAFFSVLSILILMLLVKKYTHDDLLAYFSGLALTFMPWHIEQSRVYSQVMIALTAILSEIYIFPYIKSRLLKIISCFITAGLLYIIYPTCWVFYGKIPILFKIIPNLFKLISGEFIFFKNDTFWWGGLRNFGVMLPSSVPVFFIGIFFIIKYFNKKYIWLISVFIAIWIFSGLSPFFPESREFFLITPLLVIILAVGYKYLYRRFINGNRLLKLLVMLYVFIIIYDYIHFFHFYLKHYPKRIQNELKYEQIVF